VAGWRDRKFLSLSGALALALLGGACGGGSRVDATSSAPTSPVSSAQDRSTTSTAKRSAANSTKPLTATATTKPASAHGAATSGSSATGANIVVPVVPAGAPAPGGSPAPPTTIVGPRPYDPSKPIDLGGVPGVSAAEQARAEKLVRETLRDLPKYDDPSVAYTDGYRSINDSATGDEHYVNWSYVNDGRILDSKHPESLVYEFRNGKKTLVAAMYMMPFGSRFTDVPDVGGRLTQWHIHNDLCLADNPSDPLQKVLSGATSANGACPAGSSKAGAAPMLHVWIVANRCGPFAALEGIGGGQIPPGEVRLCDRAHGSP
jgi:hypothetical protein